MLLDFYKDILEYINFKVNDDGFILYPDDKPVIVNGKPLSLPTKEALKNGTYSIFHPLLEEINKNESVIFTIFKNFANNRLNFIFSSIGAILLNIASFPALQNNLSGEQLDILLSLKDATNETLVNFRNIIIKAMKQDANSVFLNIYIKRGGIIDGVKYSRAGIISFPLYEKLLKGEDLYGVKVKKTKSLDLKTLISLHKVILPSIEMDHYNQGSNSFIAPNLDALLKTMLSVTTRYNTLLDMFENIEDKNLLYSHHSWTKYLDEINSSQANSPLLLEIKKIPMQNGNQGIVCPEEVKNSSNKEKSNSITMKEIRQQMIANMSVPNINIPIQQNRPIVAQSPQHSFQQPMYQQPMYQQPMYQQPMYQQPMYQQPMYQQPMYPQPFQNVNNGFQSNMQPSSATPGIDI